MIIWTLGVVYCTSFISDAKAGILIIVGGALEFIIELRYVDKRIY